MSLQGAKKVSELRVSTDKAELEVPLIHRFLTEQSGWAQGIPFVTVKKSIAHSLCFGGFLGSAQVDAHGLYGQFGFASLHKPQTLMERYSPSIYVSALQQAVAADRAKPRSG